MVNVTVCACNGLVMPQTSIAKPNAAVALSKALPRDFNDVSPFPFVRIVQIYSICIVEPRINALYWKAGQQTPVSARLCETLTLAARPRRLRRLSCSTDSHRRYRLRLWHFSRSYGPPRMDAY